MPHAGRNARATRTKHDRPSRLNLRSRKVKLRLQLGENLLHQIVLPHGDAAGQQQQIATQSFFDQSPQPLTAHPERSPAAPAPRPHSEPAPPANTNSNSVFAPAPGSRQSPPPRRRSKARPRAACGRPARGSCRPMPRSQCPRDPAAVRDRATVVPHALLLHAEQSSLRASRCAGSRPRPTSRPSASANACIPPSPPRPRPPAAELPS